jgi:hypothetical protein
VPPPPMVARPVVRVPDELPQLRQESPPMPASQTPPRTKTEASSTTEASSLRAPKIRGPSQLASPNNGAVSAAPSAVIASAPNVSGNEVGTSSSPAPSSGRLRSGTLALLKARECARIDLRDRPADCPSNDELMRLLANERDPKYRPENAEGFSRNEMAWRGIPPPCLDDGENFANKGGRTCVRFGNVPSRVRTVREICEARGLGGCQDAPTHDAVDAAVQQVRNQNAAKARN